MKKLQIDPNVSSVSIYGTKIIGNLRNGSFIALTTEGERLLEKIKAGDVIDISTLDSSLKELLDTALKCDIFRVESEQEDTDLPRERIYSAYIHVTHFCNYKCIGCYSENEKRNRCKDLSTSDIKLLMYKLACEGVQVLMISGGEPFLREDIVELLRYAKCELNISKIIIGSNGTRITSEIAKNIASYVDEVKISIDGYNQSVDFIRDTGATRIGIQATRILKENKVNVSLLATVHRHNYKYLKEFFELAKAEGVSIAFSVLTCDGTNDTLKRYMLNGEEFFEMVNAECEGLINIIDTSLDTDNLSFRKSCGAGEATISVDANGDVYPCHMLHFSELKMGNLLIDSMEDVMNSEIACQMKELSVDNIEKCSECQYRYFCGAGCRARAYLLKKAGQH